MSVKIVIDSTADLPEKIKDKVIIVPLTVRFGKEEYLDRIELDEKTFYKKLVEGDVTPSTSQANISDFETIYQRETEAGNELVVITISSRLSGTYNSARLAAEEYEDKVHVIDSRTLCIGMGILVSLAVSLAQSGADAETIVEILEKEKENIKLVAVFDTLEYLKRGGRLSAAAAFAGSLLSLKPIITVVDGEIKVIGKARGAKQGNAFLTREIEAAGGADFKKPLLFGYSGCEDTMLKSYILDSAHLWQGHADKLDVAIVGSVVGTHAGPGAIAVAFFTTATVI